jgi:acid phosphatase
MPVDDIPKSPYKWPLPFGQLTPKGMKQEYDLGSKARAEYVERYHLLASNYVSGTIYIRSSDVDRTLMSAQSFLTGLYPHGTGPELDGKPALPDFAQPIPIHTVAAAEEDLLFPDGPQYKFRELREKYVSPTPQWQQKKAQVEPNLARWSEATGLSLKKLEDLIPLGNTLAIYRLYNVEPPKELTDKDVQEIIEAGQWAFLAEFGAEEVGRRTGMALLQQVSGRIRDAADGKNGLKYVLFSAHDSTLMSEMSALGAPLGATPPYASRLNFSLFDTGDKNFAVKVTYNDTPVAVKGCGPASCTLEQFMTLVK